MYQASQAIFALPIPKDLWAGFWVANAAPQSENKTKAEGARVNRSPFTKANMWPLHFLYNRIPCNLPH